MKNPAKSMRATLACLLNCVWVAHLLLMPFSKEKINPKKLNFAYNIVNFSKM